MKFGVPWSVKGIRPEARETAREAARRSGMSLGEWLNSVILNQAAEEGIDPDEAGEDSYDELSSVHQRLDDISRRIDRAARSGPAAYAPRRSRDRADSDQLAAMIARLDQRLDQFADVTRPAQPSMPAVSMPPALDMAVAEIAARQRALNGQPPAPHQPMAAPIPAAVAPPRAPMPAQNLSGLEEQLRTITSQIETLRKPGVEEAINALRDELGEIAHTITDAMPRRAIDTIERQIAGLTQRIAEGRQAGGDGNALANIEHGLAEVRNALAHLTPAENLVGFNEAVGELAHKIDMIVAQQDPATMQQLEYAVTTLRDISGHVASNEAVSQLAAEVQRLAQHVEHIAMASGGGDALANLEYRINALSEALAERAQSGGAVPPRLEALVNSLSDKIEQVQNSRGDNVAVGHLEDRIAQLVERLDASDSRLGHLEAIERGLADLLVHIEDIKAGRASAASGEAAPAVDSLKHEMARTQDALDAVHGMLGQVVDRLAMIEQGMGAGWQHAASPVEHAQAEMTPFERAFGTETEPSAAPQASYAPEHEAAQFAPAHETAPDARAPMPPVSYPPPETAHFEPEQDAGRYAPEHAPADEALELSQQQVEPAPALVPLPAIEPEPPRPEVPEMPAPPLAPAAPPPPAAFAPPSPPSPPVAPPIAEPPKAAPKRMPAAHQLPIDPDLPPDQPLEPGSGPPRFRTNPAARIAASEAALGGARPAALPTTGNKSNFIAAARRAAQAAVQSAPPLRPPRSASDFADPEGGEAPPSTRERLMKRVKSMFVAASIIAVTIGGVQIASRFVDFGGPPNQVAQNAPSGDKKTAEQTPPGQSQAPETTASISEARQKSAAPLATATPPAVSAPSTTIASIPTLNVPPGASPAMAPLLNPQAPDLPGIVTGSISKPATIPTEPGPLLLPSRHELPSAIGGARLREAATAGEVAAAFEVGVRYAEGRGVAADAAEAARWFERAASKGLAPAQFRYGSMLEKGQGVKKDLALARKYYLAAANAGNAKAMHNLAVLYAEGIDSKPDYAVAAQWFRKAADHGIPDSQFNLGVLYARGLGVATSLSESYKWFALAAAKGDKEAAKKRDEIVSRLDTHGLANAQLAVRRFVAEPQPDAAVNVPVPAGGWDNAKAAPPNTKSRVHGPMVLGKR